MKRSREDRGRAKTVKLRRTSLLWCENAESIGDHRLPGGCSMAHLKGRGQTGRGLLQKGQRPRRREVCGFTVLDAHVLENLLPVVQFGQVGNFIFVVHHTCDVQMSPMRSCDKLSQECSCCAGAARPRNMTNIFVVLEQTQSGAFRCRLGITASVHLHVVHLQVLKQPASS
ncbi:hypothetical protein EYF80_000243 [Liparis tanakae]|uniref:Uncharacterized protein n=1 Tax=Liparis tanakae TaxID=230148 RepID=A0A4Z2JHI6_9TELE|nr:hypothetical protein EYF80_000243 [Liparis tanakae]